MLLTAAAVLPSWALRIKSVSKDTLKPDQPTTTGMYDDPFSTQDEFVERLRAALPATGHGFRSFYSSLAGGIVTDPALMVLPIDDHMVHRGHAGAGFDHIESVGRSQILRVNLVPQPLRAICTRSCVVEESRIVSNSKGAD